jgi:hypothetical protein
MGCLPLVGLVMVCRLGKVAFRCLSRISIIMSGMKCSLTWASRLGTILRAVA